MARIAVVAVDGAFLAGIGAMVDAFHLVNRYASQQYRDRETLPPQVETRILSMNGRPVRMADGRDLGVDEAVGGSVPWAGVYVAPFELGEKLDLAAAVAGKRVLCAWLRSQHAAGAAVAASGAGVVLLAEAGLLAGRIATVPWWLEPAFRRRYPDIEVDVSRVVAEADGVYCAGTMKAEGALALRLVERILSHNVANWVARITLIDPYPDGPEPWTIFSPRILREDGLVGRAQHWLQLRFSQKPTLRDLAQAMAVSERTLARRFERSLGMTPLDYLQALRIEAAKQMLARSARRVDRVGYLVGYSDPGFFKKVFRDKTGLSPSEYRRRAGSPLTRPTTAGAGPPP